MPPLFLSVLPLCFHLEHYLGLFSSSHLSVICQPSPYLLMVALGTTGQGLLLPLHLEFSSYDFTAQHGVCDSSIAPAAQTCVLFTLCVRPQRVEWVCWLYLGQGSTFVA